MLLTKTVEVRWNGNNKKWFIDKGYTFTKHNEFFQVKVDDLPKGSNSKVQVMCDYCLENNKETIITKIWKRYIRDNVNSVVHKDCCASCQQLKTKECNLVNYGVESKMQLEETKNKLKSTMMNLYGVEHNMQIEEVRNKTKDTYISKYGVDNPMKNKSIIEKSNASKIKRFGSKNPFTDESILEKAKNTNLEKYGHEWHMQSETIKQKSRESLYKNGSAPSSKQQDYLHELFGGELNYPVGNCSLDIAFPKDKIYIEYDGNGHNLQVKLGNMTEDEFNKREIKRYMYLKSLGWKQFRIISPCDYLPSDEVLVDEFNNAKRWFEIEGYGHSHYKIELGAVVNDDKYGKLRKLKSITFREEVVDPL